jgi:hypothetical protein
MWVSSVVVWTRMWSCDRTRAETNLLFYAADMLLFYIIQRITTPDFSIFRKSITLHQMCPKQLFLFRIRLYNPHDRQYMRSAYMIYWTQYSHTLTRLVSPSVKKAIIEQFCVTFTYVRWAIDEKIGGRIPCKCIGGPHDTKKLWAMCRAIFVILNARV